MGKRNFPSASCARWPCFTNLRELLTAAIFLAGLAIVGSGSVSAPAAAPTASDADAKLRERQVNDLIVLLKEKKYSDLESQAAQRSKSAPAEGRFLYLRAAALDGLNRGKEAEALRIRALRLNPRDEAAHAAAGEMLFDLKRWFHAAVEWEMVLHIPPAVGIHDINAHLRLADMLIIHGDNETAANHLESALDLYRAGCAAGRQMQFQGGNEQALEAKIRHLRGEKEPELRPDDKPSINIAISFKGDQLKEAQQAVKNAALILTIEVEPPEIRILELSDAEVRYRPEDGRIFFGRTELATISFPPDQKEISVAVCANDCYYIYRLFSSNTRTERVARYEKDYTIRLNPNSELRGLRKVTAKVNGLAYSWRHLLEGVPFDILPKKLQIEAEGLNAANQRERLRMEIEVAEPKVFPEENEKKPNEPPAAPPKPQPRFRKKLFAPSKGNIVERVPFYDRRSAGAKVRG